MAREPRKPVPFGVRGVLFVAILLAALWSAWALGLFGAGASGGAGASALLDFFSRALSPSLVSEAPAPFGGVSILPQVLDGVIATVRFAAAAFGLAVVLGFVLAFFGSTAWWSEEAAGGRTRFGRILRRAVAPGIYGATRVVIAVTRSVHELLWAVLFLASLGRSDLSAILAIAIPYAGIIAKVYSEMIDEAPRDSARALRAAGASPMQVFAFGLLPRALPDMATYSFYQMECALRSAAVLGFFGFPTLGSSIAASFRSGYYGEVWTYLYALVTLILLTEVWSGACRRRLAK